MPRYINVIIPVKLDFEPFYSLDEWENPVVGARVGVPFAGRIHTGVVSATDVTLPPGMKPSSVKPIYSIKEDLPLISAEEIGFWHTLAKYYLCSVGEVYRAAYPAGAKETAGSREKNPVAASTGATEGPVACDNELAEAMKGGGTLFWETDSPVDRLRGICCSTKGNVLWLVPELRVAETLRDALGSVLGDRLVLWDSGFTPAQRRNALSRIRSGRGCVVVGTRSAVLLPHKGLEMVIVQDEHDAQYKQSTPAPRYNGRDAAILLASRCGASCILTSATPSLETVFNCRCGKYRQLPALSSKEDSCSTVTIIDTRAELRKNGMVGNVPRKLLALSEKCAGAIAVFKPHRAAFPSSEQLKADLTALPGEGFFFSDDLTSNPLPPGCGLLAIFGVDALLGRSDFRADEKARQLIRKAIIQASARQIAIITREPSHPLFKGVVTGDCESLLAERRDFDYPPFTRLVDILIKDDDGQRVLRMREALMRELKTGEFSRISPISGEHTTLPFQSGGIRIALERTGRLASRKESLRETVRAFEVREKYAGHLTFDVDPL